ncbi:BUD13-like [Stylophora pistillata]|uniref:BUD13 homolog n=2 Tax=Stylophora pistillata TaxID=50429 RepID=A0A2B4RIZ5_STYPI|nr:BUD13-like [Stylophora pistillata]
MWAPISQETQSHREAEERLNFESENSTPRMVERKRLNTPDLSPRRGAVVYSSDQSPPRKNPSRKVERDSSLIHNGRHDASPADQSPPRARRRRHDSGDSLPEQPHNHNLDSLRLQESPNKSPVRRPRNDSPDLSPPRSGLNTDLDQSPPRKRVNSDSDQSPVRKHTNSDSDQSPPRKHGNGDSDQSPPRKHKRFEGRDPRTESGKQRRGDKHEERMASGQKAGLLRGSDLKQENVRKQQREAEMFATMDPSISGKGSETVYRDKMGSKNDMKLERIKRREEERREIEENEKFMEWGRGVAQTRENEEKVTDYLHEVDKPLARYRNDVDLDRMLKDQERDDDPMLAYMKQKKAKQNVREGKKEKPVYKGPDPPPNRFNIRPGYRWDGVNRSNGFENKRFAMLANKAAAQTDAYKWSTEDM